MKNLCVVVLLAALIGSMGCGSVCPLVAGEDQATHDVNCAIAIANEVDSIASIAAVVPALSQVYAIYHAALGPAIAVARDALASFESGKGGDWKGAVAFLVKLYEDIEAYYAGHGVSNIVSQAKANIAQPNYVAKTWKPAKAVKP